MPKVIDFPKKLTCRTYATLREAYDKAKTIVEEYGDLGDINISSILTRIIQDTGRFAERWASDVLYNLDDVRTLCLSHYPLEQDIDEVFVIAIRRDGVDGENFFMNRLKGTNRGPYDPYVYPTQVYRRVLAVGVKISYDRGGHRYSRPQVVCVLKDITDEIIRINPADLDTDGSLFESPFKSGVNPTPVDVYAKIKAQAAANAQAEHNADTGEEGA